MVNLPQGHGMWSRSSGSLGSSSAPLGRMWGVLSL
jgi:hypothetical protein